MSSYQLWFKRFNPTDGTVTIRRTLCYKVYFDGVPDESYAEKERELKEHIGNVSWARRTSRATLDGFQFVFLLVPSIYSSGGAPTIVEGSRWWRLLTHGLPDFGVLVERLILSDLR